MRRSIVVAAVRIAYGLLLIGFFVVWLRGFELPEVPSRAAVVRDAIFGAPYFVPIIIGVYLVAGLCFVVNRFVPLAALVLFPIVLNILLFHSFLNLGSVPKALVVFLPDAFLLYAYRDAFRPILRPKWEARGEP